MKLTPHMLPRYGGIGNTPAFDAGQVVALMVDAGADPAKVDAFIATVQQYYTRPLRQVAHRHQLTLSIPD